MLKWLKKIRCKLVSCCGSKCTIGTEDSNGDGYVDKINIEIEKELKESKK
tara:strand:+ start:437 stop:586 length:150 start_codon:yes stop_codon:yes gene_type:complete